MLFLSGVLRTLAVCPIRVFEDCLSLQTLYSPGVMEIGVSEPACRFFIHHSHFKGISHTALVSSAFYTSGWTQFVQLAW